MSRIKPGEVVFLHGLESTTNAKGAPIGGKARYLGDRFDAALPALDTSVAQRLFAARAAGQGYPPDAYEAAFATPMARAREAIGPNTRLVVASSFGGAVALRLLHEEPRWTGPVLLLAGAGPKLTPYRTLPAGVRAILVHGIHDDVVPLADSEALAASSPDAELIVVDDGHRLGTVVNDEGLGRWVMALVT